MKIQAKITSMFSLVISTQREDGGGFGFKEASSTVLVPKNYGKF